MNEIITTIGLARVFGEHRAVRELDPRVEHVPTVRRHEKPLTQRATPRESMNIVGLAAS